MYPKAELIAKEGDTFDPKGEGRRICITKFPSKTSILDLKAFFGSETIEAVTLYTHMAFVQFKRPSDYTDALLKNKNRLRDCPIEIRPYRPIDYKKEKRSDARPLTDYEIQMLGRETLRKRDLARAKLERDRRESRDRHSRSRSRERARDRDYYRRRLSQERERERERSRSSSKTRSSSRSYRHMSPRVEERRSDDKGWVVQSSTHMVTRSKPMSGVTNKETLGQQFPFKTTSVTSYTGTHTVSPLKGPQSRTPLSCPAEPTNNLQRIFSETPIALRTESEPNVAIDIPKIEQAPPSEIPANVILLMQLILDQRSAKTMSISQLDTLIHYFAEVRKEVESVLQPTRMPNAFLQITNHHVKIPKAVPSSGVATDNENVVEIPKKNSPKVKEADKVEPKSAKTEVEDANYALELRRKLLS